MKDLIAERVLNIILESGNVVYVTMNGKEVPYESAQCIDDLRRRLDDAKRTRDNHARGSELRMCYNGLMKNYRTLIKRHPLCSIVESLDHEHSEDNHQEIVSWLLSEAVVDGASTTSMAQGFKDMFGGAFKIISSTVKDVLSATWATLGAALAITSKQGNEFLQAHSRRSSQYVDERRSAMDTANRALKKSPIIMAFLGLGGAPITMDAIQAVGRTLNPKSAMDGVLEFFKDFMGEIDKRRKEKQREEMGRSSSSFDALGGDISDEEIIKKIMRIRGNNKNNESKTIIANLLLEEEGNKKTLSLKDLDNLMIFAQEVLKAAKNQKKLEEDTQIAVKIANAMINTTLESHEMIIKQLQDDAKRKEIAADIEKFNKSLEELNKSFEDFNEGFLKLSNTLETTMGSGQDSGINLDLEELPLVTTIEQNDSKMKELIQKAEKNIAQLKAQKEKSAG